MWGWCSRAQTICVIEHNTIVCMANIHFLMGEILRRIASVYESMLSKTKVDAMLCYDHALSFYSRCARAQTAFMLKHKQPV